MLRARGIAMLATAHWAFIGAMGLFGLYHLNEAYDHFRDRGTGIATRAVIAAYRAEPGATQAAIAAAGPRCTWGNAHASVHPALRAFVVGVTLDSIAAGARGVDADARAIAEERTVELVRAMAHLDEAALAELQRDAETMDARATDAMRCTVETVADALEKRA